MKNYFVYIMANRKNGALYTGMTNDLQRRVYEHKNDINQGFTKRFKIHKLVYFEVTNDVNAALATEKRLKKWRRNWKLALIEKTNPGWKDLYEQN